MEGEDKLIGQDSDKLTPAEKQFKVIGLITLGMLIKRKKMLFLMVALGIITAIVLTYIILF